MPVTNPLLSTAVAVAPLPPPPLMATLGATEYVLVPLVMVKLAALSPPSVAVAVAVVPEVGGATLTTGADA
jgi:hypothetical protein